MTVFRSSRYARILAISLITAMYLLPGMCLPVMAQQQPAARQAMLVFPFDAPAQGMPEGIGADFCTAVKDSLAGANSYMVMVFSERLAAVQRGINDGSLKKEDIAGPFASDKEHREKALKVAAAMAMDVALIGAVDEYKFDAANKSCGVTITAELVDVKTGKTAKMVTVTGRSPEGSQATDEVELRALASGDAVTKVVQGVTPEGTQVDAANTQANQTVYEQPQKKKSFWKKYLIPIVLGVAVGIAASSGGGGDDGGIVSPPQ